MKVPASQVLLMLTMSAGGDVLVGLAETPAVVEAAAAGSVFP